MGDKLEQALKQVFGAHPHVGDIRGRGLFWGVELVPARDTKRPFDPELRVHAAIKQHALDAGLLCYPLGGTSTGRRAITWCLPRPSLSSRRRSRSWSTCSKAQSPLVFAPYQTGKTQNDPTVRARLLLRLFVCRIGAGLPDPADPHHRPLRAGRHHRHRGAADGPEAVRDAGQPVIIENRTGANTAIGADAVAKSPPDGHTVLFTNDATFVLNPVLFPTLSYNVQRDFVPIATVTYVALALAVNAAVPAKHHERARRHIKSSKGQLSLRLVRRRQPAAHHGRDVQDGLPGPTSCTCLTRAPGPR